MSYVGGYGRTYRHAAQSVTSGGLATRTARARRSLLEKPNRNVLVWYCLIPALSLPMYKLFGVYAKTYYDLFCLALGLVAVFCIIVRRAVWGHELVRSLIWVLAVFLVIGCFKQMDLIQLSAWNEPQYLATFVREAKLAAYMLCAALAIGAFRPATLSAFLNGGIFFSGLVIIAALIPVVVSGDWIRPHVIDEANYDNFLVLISLIALFYLRPKHFWWYFALFLLATLVSQSRTGIATFFLLSIVYFVADCRLSGWRLLFITLALVVVPFVYAVFVERMASIDTFWELDRVRMTTVFLDYMRSASPWQHLFGQPVGAELGFSDPRVAWYVLKQTEELNAAGLHPFNLHGYHIRFIASWGVLLYLSVWVVVWRAVRRFAYWKYLAILIAVQGISMGVFYLSTVSVIFWLFVAAVGVHARKERLEEERGGLAEFQMAGSRRTFSAQ